MKRFVSVVLVAVLVFSSVPFTLRAEVAFDDLFASFLQESANSVSFVVDGLHIELQFEETPSGDKITHEYHDGVLTQRVVLYADRQYGLGVTSFHPNNGQGRVGGEAFILFDDIGTIVVGESSGSVVDFEPFNAGGVITFRHRNGMGVLPDTLHSVTVSSASRSIGSITATIRVQRTTSAILTSWLGAALGLPAVAAGAKVSWIIAAYGLFILDGNLNITEPIDVASEATDFTYSFSYQGAPGRLFPAITLRRHRITCQRSSLQGQVHWANQTAWHWPIAWNVENIWRFHSFAEVVHFNTLLPIYGNATQWSVSSW